MLAVDTLLYWTPLIGVVAAAAVILVGWRVLTARYQKIVRELEELSRRQERYLSQAPNLSPMIESRRGSATEEGWYTEFRRMVGDVLAVGLQLCAVERAREQHPELDTRVVGQLKDRGITLVSRIWLFVDRDDNPAQDLVTMLRGWILEPKPERYTEWERRAYHLAQDVIHKARSRGASEPRGAVNFGDVVITPAEQAR